MSGTVYTVKAGSAQQFTGSNLDHGATVWNTDLVDDVWVSSERSLVPGQGLRLPAQASCDWTGKQLFACLDSAATGPVDLQVSNDVVNVSNPVGIAEAIAIAGIPSTYLLDTLGNTTLAAGLSTPSIDISHYASVIIQLYRNPGGTNGEVIAHVLQSFSAGAAVVDAFYATAENTNNDSYIVVEVPVVGLFLEIHNSHPTDTLHYIILGSNRIINERRYIGWNRPPVVKQLNQAVVANTFYDLPQIDLPGGDPVPLLFAANGLLYITVSAAVATDFYLRYLQPNNNLGFLFIGRATATAAFVVYWWGMVSITAVPTINSGASAFNASIAPGPSI